MVSITKSVGNGISVTVEEDTFIEAFDAMSTIEDCFRPCPIPDSDGTFSMRVRTVEKDGETNNYYELHDNKTRARLSLGQFKEKAKSGLLFPKRKDKEKNWLPNQGWVVWEGYANASSDGGTKTKASATKTKASKDKSEIPF